TALQRENEGVSTTGLTHNSTRTYESTSRVSNPSVGKSCQSCFRSFSEIFNFSLEIKGGICLGCVKVNWTRTMGGSCIFPSPIVGPKTCPDCGFFGSKGAARPACRWNVGKDAINDRSNGD